MAPGPLQTGVGSGSDIDVRDRAGKPHLHGRSRPGRALDVDSTAVGHCDPPGDGQSQSRALSPGAEQRFERPVPNLRCHPGAIISDLDGDFVRLLNDEDGRGAAILQSFRCIDEQIEEELLQGIRITVQRDGVALPVCLERRASFLEDRCGCVHGGGDGFS